MNRNIAIKLAYDGSAFFGWQKTSRGPTIEAVLQESLEQILQERVALQAASRTDRGVHAEGQWVNFYTNKNFTLDQLKKSLNALLPAAIRVLSLYEMPLSFHPTLHSCKKEYHYQICYGPLQLPKKRLYSWHVPSLLDLEKMQSASHFFLGEQDFSSFCNFRKNLNYKDKRRNIESIELVSLTKNGLLFVILGNHFLYKMVRNIVGTLVDVGRGKIALDSIPDIFTSKSRIKAGITAPAHGLTLKKIYYPQEYITDL